MAINTIERRTSRPSDDGRRVSGRDVSTCWSPAEYEASDSEHEQPAWQVPKGAGRRAEREASTSSSKSESSDGGIDDDSLLERMAAAARRSARRVALRNATGHRATRRVERYGGLPLATIQQRWDLAMTVPKASADGVRADDDDSTQIRATRSGDVAQGHATAGHEGVQPVADNATEHARPTDAVARRAVRFGVGNAEGRGGGSWRLRSQPPAGAKQKETARGGAPPTTGGDSKHVQPALNSAPCTDPSGSGYRAARRTERSRTDEAECEGDGGRRVASRPPSGAKQAEAAHGGARPTVRRKGERVQPALNSAPCSEPSAFEYRAARRAERFETEGEERGSGGGQLPTARQPTSRVHRVANFAKWATQVAEAAKADAAAASGTVDWREERRRRKSAAHAAPTVEAEKPAIPPPTAAKAQEESGAAASALRKAARITTSRPNAPCHDSGPGIQVGARERRTVPAGHGFRVSAMVDDVAGESEQNDDGHQRRLREAAAPRARRLPELSDDETKKRRRGLTQDRGRRTLGSRQLERLQSTMSAFRFEPPAAVTKDESRRRPRRDDDGSWETGSSFDDRGKRRAHDSSKTAARAALKTSRQRQRWIHQLGALGVLPQGEGRIDSIEALGAQRQRADAYAAAAARAAPGGAGRPTPVALGSLVKEGLEAAAAAALSLDELVTLPSYSMARVA